MIKFAQDYTENESDKRPFMWDNNFSLLENPRYIGIVRMLDEMSTEDAPNDRFIKNDIKKLIPDMDRFAKENNAYIVVEEREMFYEITFTCRAFCTSFNEKSSLPFLRDICRANTFLEIFPGEYGRITIKIFALKRVDTDTFL